MKPPIHARFDLVTTLSNMAGVMLRRQNLWQVPLVGQTVGIDGNPFRVIEVGWSLPEMLNETTPAPGEHTQYAYIKVQKAANFTVVIGESEY